MNIVELEHITKSFGEVVANDRVSFTLAEGEIHALVGENGAGKSTLMNILYGLLPRDSGTIRIAGRELDSHSPAQSIALGIGMVHQNFMLVPSLSLTENLILGREPKKGLLLDLRGAEAAITEVAAKHGLEVPLREKVYRLPVSLQQRGEILKCLVRGARVLVLDEPTSVLTPQETKGLFAVLRNLREQGKSIVFISHKLREVLEIADRITVLKDGRVAGVLSAARTNEQELARLMVGREVVLPQLNEQPRRSREIALEVRGICARNNRGALAVQDVSFSVCSGEIVGIAGVAGNGQSELVEVLAGLRIPETGEVILAGQPLAPGDVAKRRDRGMAYIPQDRNHRGTVRGLSLIKNVIVDAYRRPPLSRHGLLKSREMRAFTEETIHRFLVKADSPDAPAATLSGGNLQKLVVGRELRAQPRCLIAEDPTQGVDIGSTEFIRRQIIDLAREGAAVLLVSQDLQEVMGCCDRILVMYRGRVVGERTPSTTTEEGIGLLMAGIAAEDGGKTPC
jgi:ABC-type uncharacterized transport system ATPase subunit